MAATNIVVSALGGQGTQNSGAFPAGTPNRLRPSARLYTKDTFLSSVGEENFAGADVGYLSRFIIDFPVMPDTVEIARTASYKTQNITSLPDGIHIYQYNEPIKIPIAFKLHAFDTDYCKEGPVTLLRIAAALHSLQLPIVPTAVAMQYWNKTTVGIEQEKQGIAVDISQLESLLPLNNKPPSSQLDPVSQQRLRKELAVKYKSTSTEPYALLKAAQRQANSVVENALSKNRPNIDETIFGGVGAEAMFFPPVVVLDLIRSNEPEGVGINFTGFIESVSTKLNGPWLSGENLLNLPSSLECSFTIVHSPSQTNNFNQSGFVWYSAMGPDVQKRFLNTLSVGGKSFGYASFGLGQVTH